MAEDVYNHYKFVKIPDREELEKYKKILVLTSKPIQMLLKLYKLGFIDYKILIEVLNEHGINYKKPKYAHYWQSRRGKV